MATLKNIRKRITSVKNTQKITRAMKMVAAARLRRAQMALLAARPYRNIIEANIGRLFSEEQKNAHPLLKSVEEPKKAQFLILTSDRGLCGGFNGNLLRQTEHFLSHEAAHFENKLAVVGKKGRDYYRSRKVDFDFLPLQNQDVFSFAQAQQMASQWTEKFKQGEFDRLYLVYNSFKSVISQIPTFQQIFPLAMDLDAKQTASDTEIQEKVRIPVKWEGKPEIILDQLLMRYVASYFYLAVLESQASELGARMSAMDNATSNASEMIGKLTLQYNRARQAAITTELMDIVNGAEAL